MDDQLDKSEQATPYHLDEARKKGQVARSQELVTFASFAVMLTVVMAITGTLCTILMSHVAWWIGNADHIARNWSLLPGQSAHSAISILRELILPTILACIAAIVVSIGHAGPVFSTTPITPDFDRLNPIANAKRIFSKKLLVDLMKLVAKFSAFGFVAYYLARVLLTEIMETASEPPFWIALHLWGMAKLVAELMLLVMAAAALLDWWISKRQFSQKMKMSKRDIKDEYKRREGDPEIRARRKRSHAELSKKISAISRVAAADIVLVNPTHYSVALRFRAHSMLAPEIVAMGRGVIALKIQDEARKYRIPIMRKPPLARQLYKVGKIGSTIPYEVESSVAEVYRWVISLPNSQVMSS